MEKKYPSLNMLENVKFFHKANAMILIFATLPNYNKLLPGLVSKFELKSIFYNYFNLIVIFFNLIIIL